MVLNRRLRKKAAIASGAIINRPALTPWQSYKRRTSGDCFPYRLDGFPHQVERLAGYKDALAQHSIALNENLSLTVNGRPPAGPKG